MLALGTGSREGRWKEEANNLLPGTMLISSFGCANGLEFGNRSSAAAKTEPCIGYVAAERITLALCSDSRIKQARRAWACYVWPSFSIVGAWAEAKSGLLRCRSWLMRCWSNRAQAWSTRSAYRQVRDALIKREIWKLASDT